MLIDDQTIILLGMLILFIGLLLAITALVLLSLQIADMTQESGAVVIIVPIPIIFGSDRGPVDNSSFSRSSYFGTLLRGTSGGCIVLAFPVDSHLRLGFRNKFRGWRNYPVIGFRSVSNGLLVFLSSQFSGKDCDNDYSEVD